MKTLRSTTTLILVLAAATAFAQSDSNAPSFMQLDTNEDGRISKQEAEADTRVADRFQEADTDRDGQLSLEEFTAIWY